MKNIIELVAVCLFFCSIKTSAQLDTLNYVKQFEINKANYIGFPLSKLLNDMTQVQPKTIWSTPNFINKNFTNQSRLKFCNIEQSYYNAITLSIEWETPLSRSNTRYYEQLNGFYFTNDERNFYGSKIVKDIKVYR